ncbi:recombinase [Pasteurellaceae bacterium Macca]|nr:recombinase [Pasteurellaceae bacterium Macca]
MHLSAETLIPFIEEKLAQQQIFSLLDSLCQWLRQPEEGTPSQRIQLLTKTLKKHKTTTQTLSRELCRWLCSMRIYPLLISNGILGREGFGRELRTRLYEKITPAFKDEKDLRDIFFLLFKDKHDSDWISAMPLRDWDSLFTLLRRHASPHERETVDNHLRYEGLFAIKMLSIWIAAEEMEPELMRLDPALLEADSPFIALQREVMHWIDARKQNQAFDDAHLQVMFAQSRELIERLKKKGANMGSSLGVAYLLERLEQTLNRLDTLMEVFASNRFLPRRILLLTSHLAVASADQHSVTRLWKQSVHMLSRSITQNTSDHGEHYITRSTSEYWTMFLSAAAGGLLIAFMALLKIYLGGIITDKVWKGIAEGLNYGLGFTLIFMLHGTVATKQPAMTAARFAEAVGQNSQGKSVNLQLAQLLIDVFRSQSIAVLGNVLIAVSVSALIAVGYQSFNGTPLLSESQVGYQLHSIDPTAGTLWFAGIAGVWLFFSGIISGFFDNRCHYLNLRMRLQEHPLLKRLMAPATRERFANYLHENYGSIMGNFCFGMLLGLTGVVGYWLGLPLDIRHIAFSSANIGYASVSGEFGIALFTQSLFFVLLIGVVNLIVSFSLALNLALRSLNTEVESWKEIAKSVWQLVKQRPLSLFLP